MCHLCMSMRGKHVFYRRPCCPWILLHDLLCFLCVLMLLSIMCHCHNGFVSWILIFIASFVVFSGGGSCSNIFWMGCYLHFVKFKFFLCVQSLELDLEQKISYENRY